VLGDYHTHPWKTLAVVEERRAWRPSPTDENTVPGFVQEVCEQQHNRPLFSLVVAVAEGGKSGRRTLRKQRNVVQVPVGNLFFVIGAYRILLDGTYDDSVELSLPAPVE
jgi:hypothetical protein